MFQIIYAVYKKNRNIVLRAYPWSFTISRITGAFFSLLFPVLIYYFVFQHRVSEKFIKYVGTDNYLSYIVIGQALDILAFATLMNVGRCLITEIREGTLEPFITSSASRIQYFIGAYLEQFVRSMIEYILICIIGFLLGVRLPLEKIGSFVFIVILSSISFFSVSILISTVMVLYERYLSCTKYIHDIYGMRMWSSISNRIFTISVRGFSKFFSVNANTESV